MIHGKSGQRFTTRQKTLVKKRLPANLSSMNISLGTYSRFISRDELLNKVDINRMAKASHLNIEEDEIILMGENEWNIKTFFIESKEHHTNSMGDICLAKFRYIYYT